MSHSLLATISVSPEYFLNDLHIQQKLNTECPTQLQRDEEDNQGNVVCVAYLACGAKGQKIMLRG